MFEKEKKISGPGTVVGANVKLSGTLQDVNDIAIHGSIEGEVISEKNVLIAETASVKGPVSAQIITVAGKVNGSITAWQKIEILPTGKVQGNITTRELIIRSGAIFNGRSRMMKDLKKEEKIKDKTKNKTHLSKEKEEKEANKKETSYELE